MRKKVANIVVDRKRYNEVLKFQTGKSAVKKMRESIEHGLSGNKEGQSLPDYLRTYSEVKGHVVVKSTLGEMPHVVTVSQNGSIKCDKSCKHFKKEQYGAHVLSVAISEDLLQP